MRGRNPWLLIAGGCGLTALALWLGLSVLKRDTGEQPPEQSPAPRDQPVQNPPLRGDQDRTTARREPPPASGPSLQPPGTAGGPAFRIRFRIVDARNGRTLPGARVRTSDSLQRVRAHIERAGVNLLSLSMFDRLAGCSDEHLADAGGHAAAELHSARDGWVAAACAGNLRGELVWTPEVGPMQADYDLELWEDDDLQVRVVDPRGEPIPGAAIAYEFHSAHADVHRGVPWPVREPLGQCDGQGLFRGGSRQSLARVVKLFGGGPRVGFLHDVPGGDAAPAYVRLEPRAGNPVQVRGVATSQVLVSVRDQDSGRPPTGARLTVDVADQRSGARRPWVFEVPADGELKFSCAAGRGLDLIAETAAGRKSELVRCTSPVAGSTSEKVLVSLPAPARGESWTAVLAKADGRALANAICQVRVLDELGMVFHQPVRTSADGRVGWSAAWRTPGLHQVVVQAPEARACAVMTFTVPGRGRQDLGLIRLEPLQTLLRCRILGQGGVVLDNASLHVVAVDGDRARALACQVRTEDGAWHVQGPQGAKALTVQILAGDLDRLPRVIACSSELTDIRVDEGSSIVARVLVDPIVDPARTIVRLQSGPSSMQQRMLNVTLVDHAGSMQEWRCAVGGVADGSHRLSLHLLAAPVRIAEVSFAAPTTGEVLLDARGKVGRVLLDTRNRDARGQACTLVVLPESGAMAAGATPADACSIRFGEEFLVPDRPLRVLIVARGHLVEEALIRPGLPRLEAASMPAPVAEPPPSRQEWVSGPWSPNARCRVWSASTKGFTERTLAAIAEAGRTDILAFPGEYLLHEDSGPAGPGAKRRITVDSAGKIERH